MITDEMHGSIVTVSNVYLKKQNNTESSKVKQNWNTILLVRLPL